MFTKQDLEKYLNILTKSGVDFAEIFVEKKKISRINFLNKKLDNIQITTKKGIGIRLIDNQKTTYVSLSNPTTEEIRKTCEELAGLYNKNPRKIKLQEKKYSSLIPVKIPFDKYPMEEKIVLLKRIDQIARNYSSLVYQVEARLKEEESEIIIANTQGIYTKNKKNNLRLFIAISTSQGEKLARYYDRYGKSMGYEMLDEIDIEKMTVEIVKKSLEKLSSTQVTGGEMPAIITKGWGAVLIHEACGHGLEATSVAPGFSVFKKKQNKKIASSKVTLIDDATIPNAWGSYTIDDEGMKSQKRILIEKGILKNYLIDLANAKRMNQPSNGCGRRESYQYAPTSRMSNTYLEKGTDKIEDMIKSIDYGIYATNLNGGSVNTNTGDFNFSVDMGYLIEKGRITKPISSVSLIGKSHELLKNIEMVADDLELSDGYCGSESGIIPVTVGQPTVKVSKILVGGENDH